MIGMYRILSFMCIANDRRTSRNYLLKRKDIALARWALQKLNCLGLWMPGQKKGHVNLAEFAHG